MRNALVTFCVAVVLGVIFLRVRGKIGLWIAALWASLRGLLGRSGRRSSADRVRSALLSQLRRGGSPKPGWMPLRTHTASLIRGGDLEGEPAEAVTRVVDSLYAEYFAGGAPVNPGDLENELGIIGRWARGRGRSRTR